MAEQTPREPIDPQQQIAERAYVAITMMAAAYFRTLPEDEEWGERGIAFVSGLLVGIATIALNCVKPTDEAHSEMRALLVGSISQAVSDARERMGLRPLPEVQ